MKHVFLFLLALFAMSQAFADEPANGPTEQLQEIIDLLDGDSRTEALAELQLRESELVAAVRKSEDAETYMLLARIYFLTEMDAKASEAYKAALQLDPSLSDAHFFIGLIHRYAGDLDSAAASFRGAIAVNSDDQKYFVELGRTLERKDDPAAASIAYRNALALDETNFDANFNLATIYAIEGNTDGAEKLYLAAIEQEPDDLDTHFNLGQLYQNTNQHRLAIERFETVLNLNPNEWRAITKLVQANEALNEYAARDAAIERIYALWRTNASEELAEQGFYIREQRALENGRLFVLEYFELKGERARKFVFKLQDEQTGDIRFDVSLGSYDVTNIDVRATGETGPDERLYHLDGYAPDGSHYTYAFFSAVPAYEEVRDIALKALAGEYEVVSSTVITE